MRHKQCSKVVGSHIQATSHFNGITLEEAYSFLPHYMIESLEAMPDHIRDRSPAEIEKTVAPDITLRRLKLAFWAELERAYRTNTKFNPASIYRGITTASFFRNKVVNSSYRLLYIVTPSTSYNLVMEEMLHAGLQFERELLSTPHVDQEGNFDHKLAKLKLDLVNNVKNRIKGLPVARTENVNHDFKHSSDSQQSMKDIDARIRELEKLEASSGDDIEKLIEAKVSEES